MNFVTQSGIDIVIGMFKQMYMKKCTACQDALAHQKATQELAGLDPDASSMVDHAVTDVAAVEQDIRQFHHILEILGAKEFPDCDYQCGAAADSRGENDPYSGRSREDLLLENDCKVFPKNLEDMLPADRVEIFRDYSQGERPEDSESNPDAVDAFSALGDIQADILYWILGDCEMPPPDVIEYWMQSQDAEAFKHFMAAVSGKF